MTGFAVTNGAGRVHAWPFRGAYGVVDASIMPSIPAGQPPNVPDNYDGGAYRRSHQGRANDVSGPQPFSPQGRVRGRGVASKRCRDPLESVRRPVSMAGRAASPMQCLIWPDLAWATIRIEMHSVVGPHTLRLVNPAAEAGAPAQGGFMLQRTTLLSVGRRCLLDAGSLASIER